MKERRPPLKIHESAEDYLETILILSQRQPSVRSIDIATELDYSKPSVSVAMKHLRENGYITVNDEGHIKLTPSGLAIAAKIYERHTVISEILESMGVNPKVAAEDACRVEHVISTESFDAIKKYIKDHRLL
jgi:Mn-dependent DtxR family transcriptional regulator